MFLEKREQYPVGEPVRRVGPIGRDETVGDVGRSAKGDDFWHSWVACRDHLFSLSLRWMSGNRADAEDAMSKAALKAWGKFGEAGERILNEKAWFTRLLHNVCMDFHRQNAAQARCADHLSQEEDDFPILPAAGPTPEEALACREVSQRVGQILERMPQHLRQAVVMRFIKDLSYTEIAQSLKTNNALIRKRVQLARAFLRRELGDMA